MNHFCENGLTLMILQDGKLTQMKVNCEKSKSKLILSNSLNKTLTNTKHGFYKCAIAFYNYLCHSGSLNPASAQLFLFTPP